jgi:hypothetical protein
MAQRTEIRVGQQLIRWDGTRGYVALNSQGTRVFGRGESFLVEWLGLDGTVEDAEYLTVEACEQAGVALGRGLMPWATSEGRAWKPSHCRISSRSFLLF